MTKNEALTKYWGWLCAICNRGIRRILAICDEWIRRGYKDNCLQQIVSFDWGGVAIKPPWLTPKFCRAHQSNLVRKYPEHYRQFFPNVPDNLPYVWPIKKEQQDAM